MSFFMKLIEFVLVVVCPKVSTLTFVNIVKRLNILLFIVILDAVSDTLNYSIHNFKKSERYTLGFISCLHTFGRDLKFNPHIHVLFCEYASGITSPYKKVFLPFEQLRKSFQYTLLSKLEDAFGKIKFRALKNKIYANSSNGFYVYAKDNSSIDT